MILGYGAKDHSAKNLALTFIQGTGQCSGLNVCIKLELTLPHAVVKTSFHMPDANICARTQCHGKKGIQ